MDLSVVNAGEEYADSKNLQILDQMRAIEWVYENIEAGGDPERLRLVVSLQVLIHCLYIWRFLIQ